MAVTPKQAARTLVARAAQQLAHVEARRCALRERLPQLAALLRDRFGASRVVLFGSLAWGGFHAESDVDVAVEGVSIEGAADAMGDASLLMGANVEVFRLERLPEAFRARILREGEALT